MAVIRELFSHGGPRNREPALQELAVALGAQRLGSRIRDALDNDLRMAVRRGILENSAGQLTLLCRSISEYTVNHLVATLMAAIGNNWSTRSEAVVVAARSLGFRRTGQSIQAAFKSVFNATIRRGLIERDGPDRIRKAR